jgi:hypothetical protein
MLQSEIHANVIKFRDIVNRRGKKPVDIRERRKRREGYLKRATP